MIGKKCCGHCFSALGAYRCARTGEGRCVCSMDRVGHCGVPHRWTDASRRKGKHWCLTAEHCSTEAVTYE